MVTIVAHTKFEVLLLFLVASQIIIEIALFKPTSRGHSMHPEFGKGIFLPT